MNGLNFTRARHSQAGLTLIELLMAMAAISMLAMVALPVYSDWVVRARLADDIAKVGELKLRVVEYHLLNGRLPESNSDVGLPPEMASPGKYLELFYIDREPAPGTIKLVFDSIREIPALGSNNELWYQPTAINNQISWDCTGGTLVNKFRPAHCRSSEGEE